MSVTAKMKITDDFENVLELDNNFTEFLEDIFQKSCHWLLGSAVREAGLNAI
jgi:hypothetical protein